MEQYFNNHILIFSLILWGIMVIVEKYSIRNKITNMTESRFIYELCECMFCFTHHLSVIIAPLFGLVFGWNWILLLFPFAGASLFNLVRFFKR